MQQITADHRSPMQAARLRSGLTLRALAAACETAGAKVSNSQLSKIERGLYAPRPELRAVLAGLLELDPLALDFGTPTADPTLAVPATAPAAGDAA